MPSQSQQKMLAFGENANINIAFSPILPISKLPYKFVRKYSTDVVNDFFNGGKIWRRGWDLYYIWPPASAATSKPLLLVPSIQVEGLLRDISEAYPQLSVTLDELSRRERSFKITFAYTHKQLRPRFLGHCFSKEDCDSLVHVCPRPGYSHPADLGSLTLSEPSEVLMHECNLKVNLALDLDSKKRIGDKAARAHQNQIEARNWESALADTERFFGLRPARYHAPIRDAWQELTWEENQAIEAAKEAAKNVKAINPSVPPPYPCESNVIFISLDVEWYERDINKITEIGVSTLDTSDICNIAPSANGINWIPFIRSRHFRISEYKDLINNDFVKGCPGDFRFGTSEFVSLAKLPELLAACFRPPYPGPVVQHSNGMDEKRTLVLVGHDFSNDLPKIRRIGYDVSNLSTLHKSCPTPDTQKLYRAFKKQDKDAKLGEIIGEFDITPFAPFHNGGNDAAYTMQALVGIAVNSAASRK